MAPDPAGEDGCPCVIRKRRQEKAFSLRVEAPGRQEHVEIRHQTALEEAPDFAGPLLLRFLRRPATRQTRLRDHKGHRFRWPLVVLQERSNRAGEGTHRQGKRKGGALLRPARDPDVAAVPRHQLFADVQAQAQALAAGLDPLRHLVEALEDPLGHLLADTAPRISHLEEQETGILPPQADLQGHGTALGRELDRVVEENDQNLPETGRVGVGGGQIRRQVERESDPLGARAALKRIEGVAHGIRDGDAGQLDRELAGLEARDLEQVIDHRLKLSDIPQDDLLVLALLRVQLTSRPTQEDRRKLLDGSERRAQLVRDM